jgi:hypothetical protein
MEYVVGTAEISIQGERVLSFMDCEEDRAIYEVIGFKNPKITIIDYRRSGIKAIQDLLKTSKLYDFAPRFNMPAKVTIQSDEDGNVLIELDEPGEERPTQMLWIVIGLKDSIPVYDYLFEMISPTDNGAFGYVAYFNIPEFEFVDESVDLLGCKNLK